jgi:hypothetical protein
MKENLNKGDTLHRHINGKKRSGIRIMVLDTFMARVSGSVPLIRYRLAKTSALDPDPLGSEVIGML